MARRRKRALATKPWAMLAYIAGDNDLSDNGLEDIQEMCDVGASRLSHVGVQIDTEGEHDGAIRYEITEPDPTGVAHRTVIERLEEPDSGNPDVLYQFLRWGLGRYPARHRLAVVWNHGAGFRTARRDIAYDDYGSSLDMVELQRALRRAGLGPRNKLAILGFDACLMNMLEIVYQLRGETELLVGSQQTEPGDGWPYDKVLAAMNTGPAPEELARAIVRVYLRECRNVGDSNVTQSAVRTDRVEAAVRAWSLLGESLAAALPAEAPALRRVRSQVQAYEYPDYVDAVHTATLIAALARSPGVRSRARAFAGAVRDCVVAAGHEGRAVRNSHGLTIWFPPDRGLYLEFRAKYTAMDFFDRHPGWVRFLEAFHG
jgi:hypothetical protein